MADITMCDGVNCPKSLKCHRYMANPGPYQSYFTDTPFDVQKDDCDYFWNTIIEFTSY